jgi:hypothetical protein
MEVVNFFNELDLNVTLKPQSNQNATELVSGYTPKQLEILKNEMPQLDFTGERLKRLGLISKRQKNPLQIPEHILSKREKTKQIIQVELNDHDGNTWYIDQAERLNAFGFNKFKGWLCSSGYRSLIIREPGGVIKRSYSCHDEPLGTIADGFKLFPEMKECITHSCVSSADSKIPKKKASCKLDLWPLAT